MRGRAALMAAILLLALPACSSARAADGAPTGHLQVFAAASLTNVLPRIAQAFTRTHPGTSFSFDFAGTDTLTAQIEQGAPADVFIGASVSYGTELFGKGLVDRPVPLCTNSLILIVPAADPAHISSLRDLARPGIKLVIGDATVPVGVYTRTVLANLDTAYGRDYSSRVLANVVSDETDVTSVLAKVQLGEADAGFVYVTDAMSAGTGVRRIQLPAAAQATATYPVAAVKASGDPSEAEAFVRFLLGADAQSMLRTAGFAPPPGS